MAARVLISLEEVRLTFGGKPLFEELRIHINEGDKIGLIGPNGAGKTTLMKLITGELEPDGGRRFSLPGLTIGYLAQNVAHQPGDSIKDFVLAGLNQEDRTEERHHLADIVIEPLDIGADALMGTLSGGQLRRAALARWISDPRNILTWRSLVNRVWHYHFGRGIVETPSDFGQMGALPTHPELLDWLAVTFLETAGSIK